MKEVMFNSISDDDNEKDKDDKAEEKTEDSGKGGNAEGKDDSTCTRWIATAEPAIDWPVTA